MNTAYEIKAFREEVKNSLAQCSPNTTPKLYAIMKAKGDGYRKAEEMVIRKALYDRIAIGAAISHIEMELP
jgi:hypothetical protein